ncbi:MAG TPA: hypothetical protein PK792_03100 [Methanothrix soehngenii]|nr:MULTISPECIES: hypothetical protein [Methanothrix]HOE45344.1 hypothetical protein [Methanothrix soehngenii]HOI19934.1 hypothetical protein [Methanothrix soehngenii]HPL20295.1 hypothetical protein [Methanothrix soehngenii]
MDLLERGSFDAHVQKRGDRKGLGVPSGKAGLIRGLCSEERLE